MGLVQLFGAGGPEALAGVTEVPNVEVACDRALAKFLPAIVRIKGT